MHFSPSKPTDSYFLGGGFFADKNMFSCIFYYATLNSESDSTTNSIYWVIKNKALYT